MATSKVTRTAAKDMTKNTGKTAVQTTLKVQDTKKEESAKTEKNISVKVEPKEEKKAPAKKAPVKKTARKTTAKKDTTEIKADVFVQIYGNEYSEQEIMKKVIAAWEAEGKKASAIKRAKLYIKPEEGKAYYVINERLKNGSTGAVDL